MAKNASSVKKPADKKKVKKDEEQSTFIHVFPEWCKGCGICVAFCPKQVLEMKDQKAVVAHAERCIKCYLCARRCPDFAIGIADINGRVDEKAKETPDEKASVKAGDQA